MKIILDTNHILDTTHIFWIQTFYQICDLNIFSPSLQLFLTVFLEEKFFLLMKSNLSFFSFMDHGFGIISEKIFA